MNASAGQRFDILLVEHNATERELMERMCKDPSPLPGPVALSVVTDAEAALDATRRNHFSVILIDNTLPGRSGLDLLRDLRAARDNTPVVMITGTGDERVGVTALEHGATDYVAKRLGFERALPVVIERALRKHALELEVERARAQADEHTRYLEQRIEDQTLSLQQALRESEALRRVGQTLAGTRDIEPALALVVRTTGELLRADAAAVLLRSGATLEVAKTWGTVEAPAGFSGTDLPTAFRKDWAEIATAPLYDRNTDLGLLWVGRSRPLPFSPQEHDLLATLADMSGLGIANLRAHAEVSTHAAGIPDHDHNDHGPARSRNGAGPRSAEQIDPERLALPTLAPGLGRLLALTAEDPAATETIENAVALDSDLAARTVELARALAPAGPPVSSLRDAVALLRPRTVRNLAFTEFTRRLLPAPRPVAQLLWEQSLVTAAGMQSLLDRREPSLADDAYLCGLVHNTGAVALNSAYPERYQLVVHRAIAEERPLFELEAEVFGFPATGLTHHLVSGWNLPRPVIEALKPWEPGSSDGGPLVIALGWARAFAWRQNPAWRKLLGDRREPDWLEREATAATRRLGLSAAALETLERDLQARSQAIRGVLA